MLSFILFHARLSAFLFLRFSSDFFTFLIATDFADTFALFRFSSFFDFAFPPLLLFLSLFSSIHYASCCFDFQFPASFSLLRFHFRHFSAACRFTADTPC